MVRFELSDGQGAFTPAVEIAGRPKTKFEMGTLSWSVEVRSDVLPDTLAFSIQSDLPIDGDANSLDPALISLLVPAIDNEQQIWVSGPVSRQLVASVNRGGKQVLQRILGSKHQPQVLVSDIFHDDGLRHAKLSGLVGSKTIRLFPFSGGVDSWAAISTYRQSNQSDPDELDALLFMDVGSHGGPSTREKNFELRFERVRQTSEALGLPLVLVKSNIQEFHRGRNHQETHTVRAAAVAHLLGAALGSNIEMLYGSTYSLDQIKVAQSKDMAVADPILLPSFSTPSIRLISANSWMTRVEKTQLLAEEPRSREHLDVCVRTSRSEKFPNCGECFKCVRTLATLDVLGMLPLFSSQFDIRSWLNDRSAYFSKAENNPDKFWKEILTIEASSSEESPH